MGGIDWRLGFILLFFFLSALSALDDYFSRPPKLYQIATSLTVIIIAFRSIFVVTLAAQASAVWLTDVNIAGCEIGIDTSVRKYTFADYPEYWN